jgi:xanthine dehydrogenase YagR molybdenum-binding subunit
MQVTYDAGSLAASFEDDIAKATVAYEQFHGPAIVDVLTEGVALIDDALAAEVTVSGSYSQPIKLHHAMEPHSTVAVWQGGSVTVRSGEASGASGPLGPRRAAGGHSHPCRGTSTVRA